MSYGNSLGGVIGDLSYLFLNGVGADPHAVYATTIPFILFFSFQLMFAIITPALISGTIAERATLKGYILFVVFWSILVYIPLCHWVWGGGFLSSMGIANFAGGTVIHMSAGFSALAGLVGVTPGAGFVLP